MGSIINVRGMFREYPMKWENAYVFSICLFARIHGHGHGYDDDTTTWVIFENL